MNSNPTAGNVNTLLSMRPATDPNGVNIDSIMPPGEHPHSRERQYRLYIPAGFDPSRPAPLLVVLHGCHQTHLDIQKMTGFDALADSRQFLVLYPYVTSYLGYRARECWGWWIKSHRTRGRGEVADIARIVTAVQKGFAVDTNRVYICGLSSGAAMAVNCLVAYSDRFAAGASVAGLAYGESASAVKSSTFAIPQYRSEKHLSDIMRRNLAGNTPPNLMIIHSDADRVVAEYATDGLERSWRQVAGLEHAEQWQLTGESCGAPWTLTGFSSHGQHRLLRLDIPGYAHGWLGGVEGEFSNPDAPHVSNLIWWYLDSARNLRDRKAANTAALEENETFEASGF